MSHSTTTLAVALLATAILTPFAIADGLLPVNPIVNGNFAGTPTGGSVVDPARPLLDTCLGIGHQATNPLYSAWGDWAIAAANDPASVDPSDPAFVDDATGYPTTSASGYAADPATLTGCDPTYSDTARLNPWEKAQDRGFMWSSDPATSFIDVTDDGDWEAVIPSVPAEHNHNMWQSVATPTQAFSADFDGFGFTLESGAIPAGANIQVGLALTPSYMQSPWVGIFWEGAVLFRANDMIHGADGKVSMHPVTRGEIICPGGYTPCLDFRAAYLAADNAGKAQLLGQTRIVQTSFWSFNNAAGPVVLDDVVIYGAKSAAETVPNVGNV